MLKNKLKTIGFISMLSIILALSSNQIIEAKCASGILDNPIVCETPGDVGPLVCIPFITDCGYVITACPGTNDKKCVGATTTLCCEGGTDKQCAAVIPAHVYWKTPKYCISLLCIANPFDMVQYGCPTDIVHFDKTCTAP